ncbi:MAG: PqqD family protein [Ignavibacteriae bacterium]|nr:MAG: PqqD family protein [Ignavibacteriota bacterium]
MMKINKKIAISESGFVFNPTTGDSYSLNPIAAEILDMLKKDLSEDEITDALLEKYDVTASVLHRSIDEFIDTLKEMKILENE